MKITTLTSDVKVHLRVRGNSGVCFYFRHNEGPLECALSGPMNNLDDQLSVTFTNPEG